MYIHDSGANSFPLRNRHQEEDKPDIGSIWHQVFFGRHKVPHSTPVVMDDLPLDLSRKQSTRALMAAISNA